MNPKIVFMGEKPLANYCLNDLLNRGQDVIAIGTRKEISDAWWGEQVVRKTAKENNIPIIKRKEIISLQPDYIISVLYPFIIEGEVLNVAKKTYNLHLAPLPEYKGCNTGSHALMNGDSQFGVTLHEMTPKLDVGDIVDKRYFPLTMQDTSKTLYEKAVNLGKEMWDLNIERILAGEAQAQTYVDDGSSAYDKYSLANKQIPKEGSMINIYNFIRALDFEPFEAAYFLNEKGKKIYLRTQQFNDKYKLKDKQLQTKLDNYLSLRKK